VGAINGYTYLERHSVPLLVLRTLFGDNWDRKPNYCWNGRMDDPVYKTYPFPPCEILK
jgi:hypothetical protein